MLAVEENDQGHIVVGTHSGGLTFIEGDSTKTYFIPGHRGALFFNITMDQIGNYWLSTNIGLYLFKRGEFKKVSFQESFTTETFFDMVIDDLGDSWLTTNVGIVWLEGKMIEAFARDEISTVLARVYDDKDGMRSRECTGATRSLLAKDGSIWVPTLASVAVIDPRNIEKNLAVPNVAITEFLIDDSTANLSQSFVGPGILRYQFKFSALSYLAPEKVKFKYILEGVDHDWIEVQDINKIEYTNLGPGDYEFLVIGSNNDGVWNEDGASHKFTVLPYFYQTIWFDFVSAIGVFAVIWILFQWRIKRVRTMNSRLTKVNEELDRFVYSASHDLRAPLASVLGLVRISRLDDTKEGKEEYLTLIEKSVNKLDHFITDIIDYSRNQRQEMSIVPIDIKEEIRQLINELRNLDEDDKISVTINCDIENIITDKRRLLVVLKNLISNAYVYFDPGKEDSFININVIREGNKVLITVSDNGLGIHSAHLDKIFKMFYRGREDSRGSGLGLYIVAETIEKLGGTVNVESEVGKGSTFQLMIPE